MFDRYRYHVSAITEAGRTVYLVEQVGGVTQFRVIEGKCNGHTPDCKGNMCAHVRAVAHPTLYANDDYLTMPRGWRGWRGTSIVCPVCKDAQCETKSKLCGL